MASFYAEAGYSLDRSRAEGAFEALLADERLGAVWLLEVEGEEVGYVVLTTRFGMEYGGLMACLDDLYVVPERRNRGLATAALAEVRAFCVDRSIRAITVAVAPDNGSAQAVYRRMGMVEEPGRRLLVLPLAEPAHTG